MNVNFATRNTHGAAIQNAPAFKEALKALCDADHVARAQPQGNMKAVLDAHSHLLEVIEAYATFSASEAVTRFSALFRPDVLPPSLYNEPEAVETPVEPGIQNRADYQKALTEVNRHAWLMVEANLEKYDTVQPNLYRSIGNRRQQARNKLNAIIEAYAQEKYREAWREIESKILELSARDNAAPSQTSPAALPTGKLPARIGDYDPLTDALTQVCRAANKVNRRVFKEWDEDGEIRNDPHVLAMEAALRRVEGVVDEYAREFAGWYLG